MTARGVALLVAVLLAGGMLALAIGEWFEQAAIEKQTPSQSDGAAK